MTEFAGRNVLVTGGAYGIGRAIVEAFRARGASVAFSYLTSAAEAATLEAETGAIGFHADLTAPGAAEALVSAASARLGPIDTLVCNTGGIIRRASVVDCPLDLWNEAFALNVTTTFLACKAVLPAMIAAGRGNIVTMSSLAGHNGGGINAVHYGTAKGALLTFTRGLAREVGPLGIRVNAIAPGEIDTSILSPGTEKIVEQQIPMHRLGTPDEVAKIIYVLCTETSSYVHGAEIHINGGQHV